MSEGIKSLQDLKVLRDTALGETGAPVDSLEQSAESAPAENKAQIFSFEGKQLTPEQLRQLLINEGTRLLKRIEFTIAQEQGMDAAAVRKIGLQYGNMIRDLDSIENLKKQGRPFSNIQARVEQLIPSTITMTREQMAKRIVPQAEVAKETQPSAVTEATVISTSTETVPEKETTVETVTHLPPHVIKPREEAAPSPSKNGNRVEVHTIESTPYTSPDTNSLAELYDLPKLSPQGLEQILDTQNGPDTLKKNLSKVFKESLGGLSVKSVRGLEKRIPEFREADEMRKWLNFNIMSNAIAPGVVRTEDIAKYLELAKKLATSVENIPAEERDALKAAVAPQKTPDNAPVAPSAAVEKSPIVAFSEMQGLIDTYTARIRNAARSNPAAIITAQGSLYTTEFQPLLVSSKDILKRLRERADAGAEQDPTLEAELATSLERLNTLSSEIATNLLDKMPSKEVPPAVPKAPEGTEVQGPRLPTNEILKSAIAGGMVKGTPETMDAINMLKIKHETYKKHREAYEAAITAHYGAYNSGTGTFWEKTRRGVGKFFGIGPKHTPELDALYTAMNNARVDFSKSRFEAMDARIKSRIAQNGANKDVLSKWNEGLKRREILRTIARSSEDMLLRQKSALSPKQAEATSFIGKLFNKIPAEKRAQMATLGAAVVGGVLGAWKAKTAVSTLGVSLLAGIVGVKLGNYTANRTDSAWTKRIENMKAESGIGSMLGNAELRSSGKAPSLRGINQLSGSFDFADVAGEDARVRESLGRVMGEEELKKRAVGTLRVATAATAALATGAVGSELADLPAYNVFGDQNKPDILPTPDSGGIGGEGGGQGKGEAVPAPEAKPVPEAVPQLDVAKEAPGNYTMVAGDNPWDLAEEKHFASKFEGMSNTERDHILDTVLDNLGKDAEMRQQVFPGYESDDFTRMPIGQEVNLDLYEKLIDKEIARHGGDVPATPAQTPEPKVETPAPEAKPEPKIEERLAPENEGQDRGIETRSAAADTQRGFMNEAPSTNIIDEHTPEQMAAQDRMYRDLMSNNTSVADASYEGPRGLENEEPSTNVEDLRTPDGKTDLGLSESENSLVDVSTEVDNLVDPKLVAAQREAIVSALDGKRAEPGFLSSFLSTTVTERGAHDVLKEMTLGQIKSEFLNAPPAAWNAFAAQNNIDSASMNRWMEYLKQVSAADSSQVPTMKLDEYLDKVSEHIISTSKPVQA